jgi:L-alanine-DL-glutamate epimerase-like enolase superfamily enzyme
LCAALETYDLQFLLDPLRSRELYLLTTLGRETTVPLAVGRTIGGPRDLLGAVRSGAAKYAIADLTRIGGLMPAKQCAAIAAAAQTHLFLSGRRFLGPGTAALLHLAASTAVLTENHECASPPLYDFLLQEPLISIRGMISVPPGPGFGVEVDREKVERHLV